MTTAALAAARRRQADRIPLPTRIALWVAVPVVIVLAWWVASLTLNTTVIVTPWESLQQIVRLFTDARLAPAYGEDAWITAQTVLLSFAGSVVIGGIGGFLLGLAPFWMRVAAPLLNGIYAVPLVTVFPLFMIFLGTGIWMRTNFAFAHGVFPMAIVVMAATVHLRTNDIHLKLAASLGMSMPQLIRVILLPAVLPSFLTAVRMTFGLCFLGGQLPRPVR
jgi:NitT/TauT family transport system permease protein